MAADAAKHATHLLASHPEDRLDEFAESRLLGGRHERLATWCHANDGAFHLGRWLKRSRRDAKERFHRRERLQIYRERAVGLRARRCPHAIRHFALNEV